MSKTSCLDRFYGLLGDLEGKIGGSRRLGDCHGRMGWPKRGVYFFFEPGESRFAKDFFPRVVRVGTHALKANSGSTLWGRLRQHKGTTNPGGGNHRGSIFRLLVGDAIQRRSPELMIESWGCGQSAPQAVRQRERPLEIRVSEYLADMTFLFVAISDIPGPDSMRGNIERNAIALLSSYDESSPEEPSSDWLGRFSTREKVCRSGLWNNRHVEESYDSAFLNHLEKFIREM